MNLIKTEHMLTSARLDSRVELEAAYAQLWRRYATTIGHKRRDRIAAERQQIRDALIRLGED